MLGIIHYTTNGTDGVSLEIQKRARALKKLNIRYKLIDKYIFPFLDLTKNRTINFLKLNLKDSKKIKCNYLQIQKEAQNFCKIFIKYFKKHKIYKLYVHNLFSLPIKPAVTLGLLKAINKLKIKTISVDHDFWQTRSYFKQECFRLLNPFPPKNNLIMHQVINSLDVKFLKNNGITNYKIINDYWDESIIKYFTGFTDFGVMNFNGLNADNQFVFLNATRIIRRKAIENSIYFVYWFKKMSEQSLLVKKEPVLLLSNIENIDKNYLLQLQKLAKELNVKLILSENKKYFWNLYKLANVILYTTIKEGFGNQFLEAIYFGKPLVLFEYPVFKVDIKPKGFKYISLGDKVVYKDQFYLVSSYKIKQAVKKLAQYLIKPQSNWNKLANKNKTLLNKHYGQQKLLSDIQEDLRWFEFK